MHDFTDMSGSGSGASAPAQSVSVLSISGESLGSEDEVLSRNSDLGLGQQQHHHHSYLPVSAAECNGDPYVIDGLDRSLL